MGSERGPRLPDLHQAQARRSEGVSGMPQRGVRGGCRLGVRVDRVLSCINSISGPGGWRLGFPVAGLWKVNSDSEACP